MMNRITRNDFTQEIAATIRAAKSSVGLSKLLKRYHERDVAKALSLLTETERERVLRLMDVPALTAVFPYLDDAAGCLAALPEARTAEVLSGMDTADALDILQELPEEERQRLAAHLAPDVRADVRRLLAFREEEIGSRMSSNFVCIPDTLTIRSAMSELVRQAGEHDNISTLYVVDKSNAFAGAIDLKDLIIARENDRLEDVIRRGYPYVLAHEKVADCVDRLAEYEEDSLPVLSESGGIVGVLTAQDLVELVDDAMGDDYAKLGGLTSEEDLRLRGRVAAGGHGDLQPCGDSDPHALSQDPHRPRRGLRPADHHRQRSGGRGDILRVGAGVPHLRIPYLKHSVPGGRQLSAAGNAAFIVRFDSFQRY